MYVEYDAGEEHDSVRKLEGCIEEIREWMKNNLLKLNDSKTEFLVIRSKYSQKDPGITSIRIGESVITATASARNIGAVMDNKLDMVLQVNAVCKASYFHLRNVGRIRRYLT